jgi:NADH-quinone oxidoreductase subunit G
MANNTKYVIIDGIKTPIDGERNLLELSRKANIDIPTFCYHSDLSVYGACRLCLVEVEGRGIVASCSTAPEAGMKVRTTTEEIREMRKIAVELLLAAHDRNCPTCAKSDACKLQNLARRLGVSEIRFKSMREMEPVDRTSPSLVRDPNKCILCGDCVRMCHEIQGIGAIDFAHRGQKVAVLPSFGKDLNQVECVYCGQCSVVCPTGALTIKSDVEKVWKAIHNPQKTVIAQIAPAVRVAIGEMFGLKPGTVAIGQLVAAMKNIGFNKVFDTSFTADLTVLEEGNEFVKRKLAGERLPQFTSCCPGWVKFVEQYYPELFPNLSTCKSPQQMFGSLAREVLPGKLGVKNEDVVIVSIMPCTAKKFEAQRPEFEHDGIRDVDYVLTTQELARMIDEAGINFNLLQPESLDLPFGFKTGAGVIFGVTGGVSEAVLRWAAEAVGGAPVEKVDYQEVRGMQGIRETVVTVGDVALKLAVVHGLANARKMAEKVKAGECDYDFIEVMSCPGGCIGGAGQPVSEYGDYRTMRTRGIFEADKMLQVHKSQENPYIAETYRDTLGEPNSHVAHHLLHTDYQSRRRISGEGLDLVTGDAEHRLTVSVCVGTSCYIRGSQGLLNALIRHVEDRGCDNMVDIRATFCYEQCNRGPSVMVGDILLEKCTFEIARDEVDRQLAAMNVM